jgi:hypothetical protein
MDALGPDRCRSDRCAPCTYYHLKLAALNGGRAELTESELEFVGATVHVHDTSGGWLQPNTAMFEIDAVLPPEDLELLQALMNAGSADRVEFMG